jgi:UDP-GlcNAc:undecaprenyl-phosphate GlcNAc-1-phosphate transferase
MTYWPETYLKVGVLAFVLSAVLMPLGIFLLRKLNVMDAVAPNKIHAKPVPRGGGIVIYIAFAIAVLWPGYRSDGMNGIMVGSFICLMVGAADDYFGGIAGFYKLITLMVVTLILSYFGVRLNVFNHAFLDVGFTMLWIVGVTSAFNGTDNMDGLASGIAVIVALLFFVIAVQAYQQAGGETSLSWFGMLAIGLVGANLGFLIYNWNPAKIFMGDSGSFFLGFTLSALGVMGEWTENRIVSCVVPVLILGVPIFDFAYIILVRIWRGETRTLRDIIDHCAPDHLSHRLVWSGFSQRKSVGFIYLICISLGTSGILLRNSDSLVDGALALVQGLATIAIIIGLMTNSDRRRRAEARDAIAKFNHEASQNGDVPHRRVTNGMS